MRLYAIRIFVDDLTVARRFYGDTLGLPIEWEFKGAAIGFNIGAILIVERVDATADPDDQALVGRFVGCSIAVEDIDAAYRDLRAKGVAFEAPPEKQQWGGTIAHFRDPSGNVLTLLGD